MTLIYSSQLVDIDWSELKLTLQADQFDNGRTPEELKLSFENSFAAVFALHNDKVVGKARALSDGVCNAYIVDVWTHSSLRRQGIASKMMEQLLEKLDGQHVYLFTDDQMDFYETLGFKAQDLGMGRVMGKWLKRY